MQKELQAERQAIKSFVEGDPLLCRYFTAFVFEELPASDRRADDVYLDEVDRCAVYIGLFGQSYGFEDTEGVSPTEREFDRATARAKPRLIFVKGADDTGRHPKMQALIPKAGAQLVRRRFNNVPDRTAALYASLVEHLERTGLLRTRPFDASACPQATLADISEDKVRWFLSRARRERQFVLDENTPPTEVLTHLNLLDAGQPTHAAILLFGRQPQRFLITSEVKCLHFHGTEVRKPIPSYQISSLGKLAFLPDEPDQADRGRILGTKSRIADNARRFRARFMFQTEVCGFNVSLRLRRARPRR